MPFPSMTQKRISGIYFRGLGILLLIYALQLIHYNAIEFPINVLIFLVYVIFTISGGVLVQFTDEEATELVRGSEKNG